LGSSGGLRLGRFLRKKRLKPGKSRLSGGNSTFKFIETHKNFPPFLFALRSLGVADQFGAIQARSCHVTNIAWNADAMLYFSDERKNPTREPSALFFFTA